jgi:murein DD-endopeptidase MepM/ murein hydrolase activator NlpD
MIPTIDGKERYLYFEPIVCERISSKAGWRRDPLKSKRKKVVINFHKGTDLPASEGTPIFNSYPGKVIWLSNDEETGAGKTIHLLHKNGLITRYKHLSKINVMLGDEVPLGRVIAESGARGHFHYVDMVRGFPLRQAKFPRLHLVHNDSVVKPFQLLRGVANKGRGNHRDVVIIAVETNGAIGFKQQPNA